MGTKRSVDFASGRGYFGKNNGVDQIEIKKEAWRCPRVKEFAEYEDQNHVHNNWNDGKRTKYL